MLKNLFKAVALLVVLVLAYGVFVDPRLLLDEQAFEARIPGLPLAWDGQKVAVVADFQLGMWLDNEDMVREALRDAVDDSVALVLIAGDFMYQPDTARAARAVSVVRPVVEAGTPVVAVLGNHDYSLMKKDSAERPPIAEYLASQLRGLGVTVLENEAVGIAAPGGGDTLWVAGIGSVWAEDSFPDRALAAVPSGAARLVLMHNPESFRQIAPGEAPMAFAAHTHGGQIRLLPGEHTSWLDIVRSGEVAADGWAADPIGAPENRLYVNRGIGFSTVPVRINCRPELTLVTLRTSSSAFRTDGPDAEAED